jgi:DNA primase catalytic core
MARIPDEQIERLKQEVSLIRLVEGQGIALKKHGKDYLGLCPFHDDREPSLVISPEKNLWHCLGACGEGGDVINWMMKSQGVSFRHAVELLRDGDFSSLAAQPVKRTTVTKLNSPLDTSAEDQALLMQVVDYYHETLKSDAEGLAYLEKRGLSREALDHFKLGVANRTLGYRLPEKNRKAGAEIRGRLQTLGILRESGHEHFNGSLVIPVINHGQVLEIYGRKLNDNLRKGTPYHLYLPGPHQGVFNIEALQASKEIILCESLIDALTFWSAGYRNVTASYGVNGFTDELLAAVKQHGTERVLIAYDRDAAGEKAAAELAEKLTQEGIDCYRVHFPKGMDANEYALQVKPAGKSLGVVIRSAVWLGKGDVPAKTTESVSPETLQIPAKSVIEEKDDLSSLDAKEETAEPLPAAVLPDPPRPDISAEVKEAEVVIVFGDRRYRIRGLNKNLSLNQLKVNVLVSRDEALHVDTLDLYAAKVRASFIKQAAIELGVKDDIIKADLGKVLLKCEALQEENIRQELEPESQAVALGDAEREEALALLKSPILLQRILDDFHTAGVVGEETNKLVGYLAAVSRKLDKPLAIIIQSTSAAGKSSLMDAVLNMIPEEERVQYSAMTGQSLFYMGETNLKNKILAIAEEEGAENASYALKLLQSEGVLTIASTGKDEATGNLVTKQYRVEGPVMLFLTTTAIDIDEELMNRCLVLTVNESREQTQAIHAMQRRQQTLEGLLQNEDRKHRVQLHRNAQRLLRPLLVANPFAERLTFIDDKTRTRRDHMKYLTLIRAIALLHQYQREVKTVTHNGQALEYIEVTLVDIETANRLAHEVLGRTLEELPPQTYTLLKHIKAMVAAVCKKQGMEHRDYRFSRREIREATGWSDGQLKIHCSRLTELEYLLVHRGGRGQSIVYELLYDGDLENRKHLMGLIDPESLRYDGKKSGQKAQKAAPSQGQVRPKSGGSQGTQNAVKPSADKGSSESKQESGEKGYIGPKNHAESYRNHAPAFTSPAHPAPEALAHPCASVAKGV